VVGEANTQDAAANDVVDPKTAQSDADFANRPHRMEVIEDYFVGEASVDDALWTASPRLAAALMDDAKARLEATRTDALTYKAADPEYFQPYSLTIKWTVAAAVGDLVSLEGFTAAFTGGAHGNYGTDARIYDLATRTEIPFAGLLSDPSAVMTDSMPVILAEIARQRGERVGGPGSADTFKGEAADAVSPDSILAGEIGLAPSREPGKFGGYTVYFSPYEIGSYAEGAYKVVVQQEIFHDALEPDYAALFAGVPVTKE
jgi:hypothetical protein